MSRRTAFQVLARTTGGLRPSAPATEADLRHVRSILLASTDDETRRPAETRFEHLFLTPLSEIDEKTTTEIDAIIDAHSGAKAAGERTPAFRIERRDLPIAGLSVPGFSPPATSGAAIERTFGPFLTRDNRKVWFDLFRMAAFVSVVRAPGGAPILFAPVHDLPGNGISYSLDAGSVWISSRLLAATAPAGVVSGLRITRGRIEFSSPATEVGTTIHADAGAIVTLTIQLDQGAEPAVGAGPGADARALRLEFPREVTFVFAPASVDVRMEAESRIRLYGSSLRLRRNAEPPAYEAAISRLLVPCDANQPTLQTTDVRSQLFQPSGAAQISKAAWALPITFVPPTSLTEAAGAGGLLVAVEAGLRADWRGLIGGPAPLGPTFLLGDREVLLVHSPSGGSRRLRQSWKLWRDAESRGRHCSFDIAYRQPLSLWFGCATNGSEVVIAGGASQAHLDRPLRADGRRLTCDVPDGVVFLGEDQTGQTLLAFGSLQSSGTGTRAESQPIPFALSNAVLNVAPRDFYLSGQLESGTLMKSGLLRLQFDVRRLLPTLPDPYAANVQIPVDRGLPEPIGKFTAAVLWADPLAPELELDLSEDISIDVLLRPAMFRERDVDASAIVTRVRLGSEHRAIAAEDARRLELLRQLFDGARVAADPELRLLDVSTNADQFGVLVRRVEQHEPDPAPAPRSLAIDGVSLATPMRNAQAITAPAVQWEPVWTIQNPDLGHFPSPLGWRNDGSPLSIGINTVRLVPIAPHPVVTGLVDDFRHGDDSTEAGASFTLPFGMVAVAAPLRRSRERFVPGASISLVAPRFTELDLTGGLQMALEAIGPLRSGDSPTPSLTGAAFQLRNGIDPATGIPLNISVLGDSGPPMSEEQVPNAVESIFNHEFGPDGSNPRVPVTRIDFSGYGASTFSRWRNPKAEFAETSKVEFNVLVGRTAYEVVQVRSVLYPWGIRVVRTITIERSGSGAPFRRDSGWVAVTDGLYDFPAHSGVPKIETHPGVVKAAVNVRRIRDTTHVYRRVYGCGEVRLAAVRFDADIRIAGVVRGATGGVVTSVDQLGFVQLAPSGRPLSPDEYADLLAEQGSLGGPVDCLIDIGESGQQMRVTRVDVASALTPGWQFQFVAAARGSLVLPQSGQWSTVRTPGDISKESVAVDRDLGVPLVRHGLTGLDDSLNPAPYKFADPATLLGSMAGGWEYGLLWSTGTQRLLFNRPKVERGARAITGERKPLLADAYALVSSAGIFPAAATSLEVPFANWSLDIPAEGQLRLSLPSATFPAVRVAGPLQRELSSAGGIRMYVDYTDTKFTVHIDSAAAPSWRYAHEGIAFVSQSNGVTVKTTRGRIQADSGAAPLFTLQGEEFGQRLDDAKSIVPMFASNDLGGSLPSGGAPTYLLATSGGGGDINVRLKREFPIPPELPAFIGLTGVDGSIEIATDFRNFFSIEAIVNINVAHLFPGAVRFKYEAKALKETIPGTSVTRRAGAEEELLLAIGFSASRKFPVLYFQAEIQAFAGIGFVHEHDPSRSSIGIGVVFSAKGTLSYPNLILNVASVGLQIEGQGVFEFRGDETFLVLKGTIAADITVALFVNIEFEIADATLVELPV
jgi:hypothetical protein